MQRLSTSLVLMAAALLLLSVPTAVPSRAMAFELDPGAATLAGGTAHFGDPDEATLPPPLPSARLEEDEMSLQMTPATNLQIAPGTHLQMAPGMNLPMAPGMDLQIAPGTRLQMAPIGGSSDNPADNRALIPSP